MGIVTDHRTLRGMEIQGFIIRRGGSKSTATHWTGMQAREYRVQVGPKLANWYTAFRHRGKLYRITYIDGSFHPFVTEVGKEVPAFV